MSLTPSKPAWPFLTPSANTSRDRNANGLREYAAKVLSDPGTHDGLYWPTTANEPSSPLGPLVAAAAEEGYTPRASRDLAPQPYRGYYFHILTRQGARPGARWITCWMAS